MSQWKSGIRPIPWVKLKEIVDKKGVTWDWLIEGREPRFRSTREDIPSPQFNRLEINTRFLALFPELPQAKLGKLLGVGQVTVSKWKSGVKQVPWDKLKFAVDTFGVTWEWLIEGRR